jgi:hypothetical protein
VADTAPIGDDHGSGSAGTARICLPCASDLVDRGGASKWLRKQVAVMENRASQHA